MALYYYLDNETNKEFLTLMYSLNIKFSKSTVEIYSKKYIFISIIEKKDFFQNLLMAGVFNHCIFPFTEISI